MFKNLIPKLPEFYDEPLGAGSSIPTYLVSKLAKEHVKVSLSADGGDEVFGGYSKYEVIKRFYPRIASMPTGIKSILSLWLQNVNPIFF